MSDFELVRDGRVQCRLADGVGLITLNRPDKHNAFDAEQLDAWEAALEWFHRTPEVRVGVVTGAGRSFCAGGDITTFDAIDVDAGQPYTRRGYEMLRPIETGEKPMLAGVDGYCLAGGLELALACDFIIAGAGAKFGFGEVRLGLIPGYGGTVRITRAIPTRVARQLVLTNERFGPERAERLGLVNEVVAEGGAAERAIELARLIASQPAVAVRTAKLAMRIAADETLEGALATERTAGALLFGTKDVHRNVRAWTEGKID